jgi:AcrR family transcriptional regulator
MSIKRSRLSPQASRDAALEAARAILLEHGPQAVTLKAVASRIGRTHANLLYHFGTADALQQALAADIVTRSGAMIAKRIAAAREDSGKAGAELIVDLFFDAFGGGGGALAAWLSLTSDAVALAAVFAETRRLIEDTTVLDAQTGRVAAFQLMVSALGDALIGGPLAEALDLPRDTARALAVSRLNALLAAQNDDAAASTR